MAKTTDKAKEPQTRDDWMAWAIAHRDEARNVRVIAVRECRDNGVTHPPGEEFLMDWSLVPDHVLAGVVQPVD